MSGLGWWAFDLETDGLVGSGGPRALRVTVAAACRVNTIVSNEPLLFFGDREGDLERLAELLDGADRISAYNGRAFDIPVLSSHVDDDDDDAAAATGASSRAARWCAKLLDPFEIVRATTGRWLKLDALLLANGLSAKSGSGKDAVLWWHAGHRDRVAAYCADDVRLLRSLLLLDRIDLPAVIPVIPTSPRSYLDWRGVCETHAQRSKNVF